jgi:hypothetical protein
MTLKKEPGGRERMKSVRQTRACFIRAPLIDPLQSMTKMNSLFSLTPSICRGLNIVADSRRPEHAAALRSGCRSAVVMSSAGASGALSIRSKPADASYAAETFAVIDKTDPGSQCASENSNAPLKEVPTHETEPPGVQTSSGNLKKVEDDPDDEAANAHSTDTSQGCPGGRFPSANSTRPFPRSCRRSAARPSAVASAKISAAAFFSSRTTRISSSPIRKVVPYMQSLLLFGTM